MSGRNFSYDFPVGEDAQPFPTAPDAMLSATDDLPAVLTPNQVADLLQADPDTIREWLRRGLLDGRKIGERWKIPRSAVVDENGTIRGDIGPTYFDDE